MTKHFRFDFGLLTIVSLAVLMFSGCDDACNEARPPKNVEALPQKHTAALRKAPPSMDEKGFGKAKKNTNTGGN